MKSSVHACMTVFYSEATFLYRYNFDLILVMIIVLFLRTTLMISARWLGCATPSHSPFLAGNWQDRSIIFMAVTTHANHGSYRHQQLSERLFSSGSLSRIRDQGGERRTSGSDQLQTSYNQRKMTNTVRASNKAAILAVGEELRLLLREEDPPLIKDRRYHLRVYQECFVGHEMVDWLLKKGEVESRKEAVAMMQKLLDHGVIHHGERESS